MALCGEYQTDRIRQGRAKFIAMACTYALGVFNDQFFKQAAILIALTLGLKDYQGYIVMAFTLPYIICAAPAGWLADRFSKGLIVRYAKALELAAMICGVTGILMGNWWLIMTMAFMMGLQSTIFSPSLNGSIPELFPACYVTQANSILKVAVTVMILGGVACAGFALDVPGPSYLGVEFGRWVVAAIVLGVSVLGLIGSFGVPRRPPAAPEAKFPWTGPWDTLGELKRIAGDSLLLTVVVGDVFVWFVGSLQILVINAMGIDQFGYSKTNTSLLVAAEVIGIAIGGLIAGRIAAGRRWYRVLPASSAIMAVAGVGVALTPLLPESILFATLLALFALLGVAGGVFMIPCESFIQVRPKAHRKGAVIAAANSAIFIGILLTGLIANLLNRHLLPTRSFLIVAALSAGMTVWLGAVLKKEARST